MQIKLKKDITSFVKVVKQLGMVMKVASLLNQTQETGKKLQAAYVTERLQNAPVVVSDTIRHNNKLTFYN